MKNIFETIPDNIDTEIFEQLAAGNGTRIERIVSKGHTSPASGWYDQDENEWVLLLTGGAVLLFEDNSSINLKAGDYINIPAHRKHKVTWTDPETETVWLAVFYGE